MKVDTHYQERKDSPACVDFSNVHIVHYFTGWADP